MNKATNKIKCVISDIHLGLFQQFATINSDGMNSRLMLQYKAIIEAMETAACKNYNAKVLIIAGDVFHVRGLVEVEAYNVFRKLLERAVRLFDEVIVMTGNHDITHENTAIFNALNVFNEFKSKVSVINAGTAVIRDDLKSIFVGFTSKDENNLAINLYTNKYRHYDLYTHQSIIGATYRKKVLEEGFSLPNLYRFKRVFNGHIHEPSKIKNVYNLGSLYPIDFGDTGDRYFYIIEENKVKYVPSIHPLFITVKDPKQIKKDGNFYRVVSDKATNMGDNVKVVIQKKLTYDRGIDYSDPSSIIESYCKNVSNEGMIKHGIKILQKANK